MTNFGSSKSDLRLKYRLGLEYSLAKADFLNAPDIILVQAFANFLCVVRRYDSPRVVWMMTGLIIRMAQYLGLQRDGSNFEHFTPFEIETRRRIWWAVVNLDLRASEDQGTDLAITHGSFDTKMPLNINDADIGPETKDMPTAREGVTDMSLALMIIGLCDLIRQMLNLGVTNSVGGLEDQNRLLKEMYRKYEHGYFRQSTTESDSKGYWVGVTIARLVMAKMTLIVCLPALFSSPSEHFSEEIRTKLLVAAIDVAEFNHTLNAEPAYRQLRWMYQTYTHWHAIVYLMMEIARRPWSATVERAWVALHSSWLIPAQIPRDKTLHIWFPLRKLMAKARGHRSAELSRLRGDPEAATRLDIEDRKIPLHSSSGPMLPTGGGGVNSFRERWFQLVATLEGPGDGTQASGVSVAGGLAEPSVCAVHTRSISGYQPCGSGSTMIVDPSYLVTSERLAGQSQTLAIANARDSEPAVPANTSSIGLVSEQTAAPGPPANIFLPLPADWSDGHPIGPGGFVPWLRADADPSANHSVDLSARLDEDSIDVNMNWDGSEMNWYSWIESAEGLGADANPS
jgi:hypothetical protein